MKNTKTKSTPTPIGGIPAAFAHIQETCARYRGELDLVKATVLKLTAERKAIDDRYLPTIQRRAKLIGENKITLTDLVDRNRPLFDKPKTRIFSDIKVGLRKLEGETVIADPAQTLALIQKHFPERLDELAPATRSLSKEALKNLTGAELKKIGVEITADSDAIVVKPMANDIEKAVAALIQQFNAIDA